MALAKVIAAEEAERKLERAIRAGKVRRYHGIDWIGDAAAQGVVTESEAQLLREAEALTAARDRGRSFRPRRGQAEFPIRGQAPQRAPDSVAAE